MKTSQMLSDRKSDAPREGIYWWIPISEGDHDRWELFCVFETENSAGQLHAEHWPSVVRRLAAVWQKQVPEMLKALDGCYTGLPRGRVVRTRGKVPDVWGGKNDPAPTVAIWREFHLSLASDYQYDPHERVFQDHAVKVQQVLGVNLGLSPGVMTMEELLEDPEAKITFSSRSASLKRLRNTSLAKEDTFRGLPMGSLNENQLAFLWGYALERGTLNLGPYHAIADAHGADRVETMRLAFLAMDEMPKGIPQTVEDLPEPPEWPFPDGVKPLLEQMSHRKD
jgi:hypothetical protein